MIIAVLVLAALCCAAGVWALLAERRAATLAAELDAERRASADKLALVDQARATLRDTFGALSAEALRHNNESFLQLAQSSFDPVKTTLDQLGDHLRQTDREHFELRGQLRSFGDTQELLRQQTKALVSALKSPNQRGRWGEVQLRNIVERAGMAEYCGDFTEKSFAADENGRRAIPDMTVRLPNGSCIVIDSKVPIDAYLNAVEAEDTKRDMLMRDHARQVREHIKRLASKAYWSRFTPTPELVVMFVPGEPLFSAALQHDAALFDFAADQRVIPASPLTLLALLRTVASAWQQQRLTQSAEEVRALGTELYERLAVMADNIQSVGSNLKQAGAAYDRFIGSLESRVLVTARRFKDLGVSAAKDLPELEPTRIEVREPRAPELRAPIQESLIETGNPEPATVSQRSA